MFFLCKNNKKKNKTIDLNQKKLPIEGIYVFFLTIDHFFSLYLQQKLGMTFESFNRTRFFIR